MSDYSDKLAAIKQKQEKLHQEESKLIERRKKDIANLAERCGVLIASDETLAGLFIEYENALKVKDIKIKEWQLNGEKFLKPTKSNNSETAKS
jgi:hypothetical protein